MDLTDHRRSGAKQDAWWLVGIVVLAFLLRATVLLVAAGHIERAYAPDTPTYLAPALKLLASGLYPADSAWRTPGYPLFLALIYRLGGGQPFLVVLAQVLLSTLTVFLTYRLGLRLLSRPAALIGTLLLAVSVESITQGFYLLTETLFTTLLAAGLLAWVRAWQEKRLLWTWVAALLLGLGTLVRPVAVFFPALLALAWFFRPGLAWLRRLSFAALLLAVYLLSLLPWLVRNQVVLGIPTISTISNYNLLYYNAASLEASLQHQSQAEVVAAYPARIQAALTANGWADTEANRDRVEGSLARQILLAHPARYLFIHLRSDLNGLIPDVTGPTEILGLTVGQKGTLSVLNQSGLLAAIRNYYGGQWWILLLTLPVILLLGLVYLLDLAGTIALARGRAGLAAFVLLAPALYFILLPGAASLPRFRVPVMPLLCLLAGLGGGWTWETVRARRKSMRLQPSQEDAK